MPESRFKVLPDNPLVVRDTTEGKNIHLGSRPEAKELCDLLNGFADYILELTAKITKLREVIKRG